MAEFVNTDSIVRQIWGKSDTILFIFAGASAEFALNKAVDWLYFTGKLPADPIGRLFSTVAYARKIIFSEQQSALDAIDSITAIHAQVEAKRGAAIPDWAFRDVLFMLIDYSIRSFEVLERKLGAAEKEEVFNVFYRVGSRMGLIGLPQTFADWEVMRREHLRQNFERSQYTDNLFTQYRKHLGFARYRILLEVQKLILPRQIRKLLGLSDTSFLTPVIQVYKFGKKWDADKMLKALILPAQYKDKIKSLDYLQS